MPVDVLREHDWGLLGRCGVDRGFQNAAVFDCMRCLSKKKTFQGYSVPKLTWTLTKAVTTPGKPSSALSMCW